VKKILFLDFDGVLHPASAYQTAAFSCAPALAQCLRPYDCDIVISSSWRFNYSRLELMHFLPDELAQRVTGMTGPTQGGKLARYQEIRSYLLRKLQLATYSWRALDDSKWEFPMDLPELIACNPNTGLQDQQLDALERWLMDDASIRLS
jgi:hypothetical protein